MFKNFTPHSVSFVKDNGEVEQLVPEPVAARVFTVENYETTVDGVDIFNLTYGQVENLPAPEDGVYLIVSKMVRDACPDRTDLFYPTRLIRDETGVIVGCGGLAH